MDHAPSDFRKHSRLELRIPVRVRVRETGGHEWGELSHLIDVTQLGASFSTKQAIQVGRVIHLSMPLPWRLRQYDHSEEQYRIYALVRWVRRDGDGFAIGVAFVGKNPPASYVHDPSRVYGTPKGENEQEDLRREGRIQAAMSVQLELIDERGEVVRSEMTVTENISRHGASCYTTLKPNPGSLIRISSQQTRFATTAIVRKCRTGTDNIPRVHLEFVGEGWPLDIEEASAD